MIFWFATRTGRRLHLVPLAANRRTLCNRPGSDLICLATPGHDSTRWNDPRATCQDCYRVAGYITQAAAP